MISCNFQSEPSHSLVENVFVIFRNDIAQPQKVAVRDVAQNGDDVVLL